MALKSIEFRCEEVYNRLRKDHIYRDVGSEAVRVARLGKLFSTILDKLFCTSDILFYIYSTSSWADIESENFNLIIIANLNLTLVKIKTYN